MNKDTAVNLAEELLLVMTQIMELLNGLIICAKEKEALLTSQDVEGLIPLREKEEQLIAELGNREDERSEIAQKLASVVGVESLMPQLDQLIEKISDSSCKARLSSAKEIMAEKIKLLSLLNAKNSELLKYQINYTDYMINLLLVPRSKSVFYNVQGSRNEESRNISLLDCHI